ncbi:MAG: segregation/condensation protein A [Planctomycetota bacterium]
MSDYRVNLKAYSGPLDLLLFLIRRSEVDIHDIPIAEVTRQYMEYIHVLKHLDPDSAGEFLVLAATLMEIKSRVLLPRPPIEEESGPLIDPRSELVRQLLAYQEFKEKARYLEESGDIHSQRFPRAPVLPHDLREGKELENVDVWDLFHAFQRLWDQVGKTGPVHKVEVDETPLSLHADDILDSVDKAGGAQPFDIIFTGRRRAEMIGMFLALLELIRQKRIRASQDSPFGPILIHLLDRSSLGPIPEEEVWQEPIESIAQKIVSKPADEVLPAWDQDFSNETSSESFRETSDDFETRADPLALDTLHDSNAELTEPSSSKPSPLTGGTTGG